MTRVFETRGWNNSRIRFSEIFFKQETKEKSSLGWKLIGIFSAPTNLQASDCFHFRERERGKETRILFYFLCYFANQSYTIITSFCFSRRR